MKIDELANIKRRTEVELSGFLSYQIEKFKICDEIIDIDTLERLHVFTFAEVERAYGEASIEIQSFPKFNLYRENKISYKQKILSYLMDLQEKVNIMGIPASSKLLNAYNSSNSVQTTNPSSNINISNINTNSNI